MNHKVLLSPEQRQAVRKVFCESASIFGTTERARNWMRAPNGFLEGRSPADIVAFSKPERQAVHDVLKKIRRDLKG